MTRGCGDPNDCDIAPDGRIFFTDSTTRYDAHEWALDSIEARPTGRLLCYEPKTGKTTTVLEKLRYANGVCMAHDEKSLFLAESWACSVHRYWFRRTQGGNARMRDQGHAGLSRQHQPRIGRHLLDGLARHADAELRPRPAPSRHAQAHDPQPAAGRLALPQHQYRRRRQIRRDGKDHRHVRRPDRRLAPRW